MLKIIGLTVAALVASVGAASAAERKAPSYEDWNGTWINITLGPLSNLGTISPIPSQGKNPPPLKPEFNKKRTEAILAAQAGNPTDDPGADCKWPGVPGIMSSTMPQEFVILPDKVLILYENLSQVRRIFTDGSKPPEDLEPSYNGFSMGRWEGDTLVVETVGLRDDTYIDVGTQHTEQLKVVERYRQVEPNIIEVDVTLTDPGILTAPWGGKIRYRRLPPGPANRVLEYACTDNNRNGVGADGATYTRGSDGKLL